MSDSQLRNIFIHVQEAVSTLIEVDRFYAALLYLDQDQMRFPYAWMNGSELPIDHAPWTQRKLNERWSLDKEMKQGGRLSLLSEGKYWPPGGKKPKSCLGIPVNIDENTVLGLVVENWRIENAYDDNDVRILETITRQSALSIRNAQLVREWQESEKKRRAAERFMAVNKVAGEFAHSMNNVAGTIPIRIKLARRNLNPKDHKQAQVLDHLEHIDFATRRLLEKAREVKEATQLRARESVEVNALVDNAIKRAIASQPNATRRIKVKKELGKGLPKIEVERDIFIDTLTSIVRNGLEAMPERGTLSVSTRHIKKTGTPTIEIIVSDNGVGIPKKDLNKIFDPFFTTKETGMGFGLWRDKTVIEELGGRIDVDSEPSKGTTFSIRLPVK